MIKVLQSGFYTSIQDKGRFGYQDIGVPCSGSMDSFASDIANLILGNDINNAVLEFAVKGPQLQFSCSTIVAIAGANMLPELNGISVANHKIIPVKNGDILSFKGAINGFRAYLAVKGGFDSKMKLNSRSMYQGITSQNQVKKGNILKINNVEIVGTPKNASLNISTDYLVQNKIEVDKGPEYSQLSEINRTQLTDNFFTIETSSNRMAYQFKERLVNTNEQLITSPVIPGTVQLTPSGQIIVLMRDCQTTGGYPRILQLTEKGINTLSQQKAGNRIFFRLKD